MSLSRLPLGADSVRGLFAWPRSAWQKLREGDCGKQRLTVLQTLLEKGVDVFTGRSSTGNGAGGTLTTGFASHFAVLYGGGHHELLAFPCFGADSCASITVHDSSNLKNPLVVFAAPLSSFPLFPLLRGPALWDPFLGALPRGGAHCAAGGPAFAAAFTPARVRRGASGVSSWCARRWGRAL